MYSLLRNEAPYDEIIVELENGKIQVVKNDEVYKRMNGILAVHSHHQNAEIYFWRIVVPSDARTKEKIMQELHSTPYSAHPSIQRTSGKGRGSFFWKRMMGDIHSLVENFPVCQMEKSDHTLSKGKLQSTQIPETKWSEISIDFVIDLPKSSRNRDSILVVVDKATRMVHLAPCSKDINATDTARLLWNTVVKLHGVPTVIYNDRGSQFTTEIWKEFVETHWNKISLQYCLPPTNTRGG